jgi:hypothetical protein
MIRLQPIVEIFDLPVLNALALKGWQPRLGEPVCHALGRVERFNQSRRQKTGATPNSFDERPAGPRPRTPIITPEVDIFRECLYIYALY